MTQVLPVPSRADRQIVYAGITWPQFKLIQAGFADAPGIRLAYFNRTIEILMPGRTHELFKSMLGMLVELYCLEMAIEFEPMGSMTQEREGVVAVEADESYCFGTSKPIPDLAIEIVLTSGGEDKLPRYLLLEVPEVWFWQDGVFRLYHLHGEGYVLVSRSEIPELSHLDLDLLSRCLLMAETSRLQAAQTFRQGIGGLTT